MCSVASESERPDDDFTLEWETGGLETLDTNGRKPALKFQRKSKLITENTEPEENCQQARVAGSGSILQHLSQASLCLHLCPACL